ncbi:MAG: protein kinase domain-containing protein [Thermoanaerobaculia bacterium]
MSLAPGTRLGPYEVLSPLGAGGMGEVYRARDSRLNREVAVKVLPEALWKNTEALARFQHEARAVAALSHPNILDIHDFGSADGVTYAVTELLEGHTLREEIVSRPLPERRVVDYAVQVAKGLSAAHERGVVHRDLKPENLFVTSDGQVKILDFGLARRVEPSSRDDASTAPTASHHTAPGTVMGTLAYMSPEQVKGHSVDARSDIFSFGAVLYEMLSGRKAFHRDSAAETMAAILREEPPELARSGVAVSAALERVVTHCLEKSPELRFQSARDVVFALEDRSSGAEVSSSKPATGGRGAAPPLAGRLGGRTRLIAGATILVTVGALLWLSIRGRSGTALPSSMLLAVLPATDLTGRADGRQLCDGVSFSLGVKLQGVPGITIMRPSGPSMLRETDPVKWARDTGANLLVQPAVRQMGNTRQLSFSIALAGSPVQIAAGEVTGLSADHFRLENELTEQLAAALRVHLETGASVPTPGVPAGPQQTNYIVALGHLERYDDRASVDRAIDLLEAIPGGARSAPVTAALGRAYLASYRLSKDVSTAALAAGTAQRAIGLAPTLPEAQVTLGEVLTETGRAGEAVDVLRKALAGDPRSVPALLALVEALGRSGDAGGAEKAALRVVELRPTSPVAFNRLGVLYFLTSRYEKAVEAFRQAIALNPDVPRAHLNLGAALLRLGRFEEARAALEETIRIEPVPQAYSNLGVAQYLLGRHPEAAASFQRAVDLAPKDYRWHIYLGDALSQVPNGAGDARRAYESALPLVRAELSVDPADGLNVVLYGRCLARTGEPERAWSEIRRGVGLAPEDENVLQTAAAAAMLLGKRSEALSWLEMAVARGYGLVEIERDPDFAPLRGDPAFRRLASFAPTPTTPPPSTGEKR